MFSKTRFKPRHSLAFRLTLWYAVIFTVCASVAFLFFYWYIISALRKQTDQDLYNQVGVFSSLLAVEGIEAVKKVAVLEAQAAGEKKFFLRLLYPTGEVFSSSNMSYWKNIGVHRSAIRQLLGGSRYVFETVQIPDHRHQVRILYGIIGPRIILQLGQSMENYARFIQVFKKIFVAVMGTLIVFSAVIGWFMARRAVSGVEAVTRTAREISEGALNRRVPVKAGGDEIDQLAATFNHMLDRIQKLISGIKEMSDNIAHDLKSPITRMRGIAEVTLTTGKSVDEFANMGASMIEECDRLLDMINTMLVISQTEAGVGRLEPVEMDAARVVGDACDLFGPVIEDKQINLICEIPDKCIITGDLRLIQRMIANLLDNAIKYTPPQGTVSVSLHTDPAQQVVFTVQDTGVGIAPDDLPRIFERFYRCDRSRSQAGIGLGLSLARAIARAHGGDIKVSSHPHQGSCFVAILPEPHKK